MATPIKSKFNALADLRRMVHSDDEDDDDEGVYTNSDFQFTNTVLSTPSVEFTSSTPSQLKGILKQSKSHQSPAPNPSESIHIKQDGEKNGEQPKQNVEDLSNKGKSLARRGVGQLLLQLKGEPNSTPDTTFKKPENKKTPPQLTTCTPSTSELKNESQTEENSVPITNKTTPVLSNKVDQTSLVSKPEVVEDIPKHLVKISGLPLEFSMNKLITFLGIWPSNGQDGIRIIRKLDGSSAGYGYILLETHNHKMELFKANGMTFDGRHDISILTAKVEDMQKEWARTCMIKIHIEESPFVCVSRLDTSTTKQDLLQALAPYRRTLEDIFYIPEANPSGPDSRKAYIVFDNASLALEFIGSDFEIENRKLETSQCHPLIVQRWMQKNDVILALRPSIQYGMKDLRPLYGTEQEIEELFQQILKTPTKPTPPPPVKQPPPLDSKPPAKVDQFIDAINSDPSTDVFVYDPDDKNYEAVRNSNPNNLRSLNKTEENTPASLAKEREEIRKQILSDLLAGNILPASEVNNLRKIDFDKLRNQRDMPPRDPAMFRDPPGFMGSAPFPRDHWHPRNFGPPMGGMHPRMMRGPPGEFGPPRGPEFGPQWWPRGGPWMGPPRELSPRRGPPRELSPRRGPPRELSPRRGPPREFSPLRRPPREFSPSRDPRRELSPRTELTRELSSKRSYSKERSPRTEPPREHSQRRGYSREHSLQSGYSRDPSPRREVSRDHSSRSRYSRERSPRNGYSRERSPRGPPIEHSSRRGYSRDPSPRREVPKDHSLRSRYSRERSPRKRHSRDSSLKRDWGSRRSTSPRRLKESSRKRDQRSLSPLPRKRRYSRDRSPRRRSPLESGKRSKERSPRRDRRSRSPYRHTRPRTRERSPLKEYRSQRRSRERSPWKNLYRSMEKSKDKLATKAKSPQQRKKVPSPVKDKIPIKEKILPKVKILPKNTVQTKDKQPKKDPVNTEVKKEKKSKKKSSMETSGFMGPMGPMGPFAPPMGAMPMGPGMMMGPMGPHGPMGPRGPMGPMNMRGPTGPFGPGPPNMNMRPMGPMMAPGMPGIGPTRPAMMMSIYVRAYNIPDKATTEDIREYFAPILPAKIAQNIGYNIYDIDFYNPADARNALQKSGMMIRKNVVQLQLLPGPPVPLPPRPFKRKKKRSNSSDNQNENLTPHKDETAEEPVPEIEQEEEKEKIHVEPFPEDDPFKYRLPPFNPDEPAGQCAIEPMEGFYCQLCRKFYRSKSAAYSSHCKSKGHYDNVKIQLEKMKALRSENENNRSSSDIDKNDVTDFNRERSVGKKRKKD